MNASDSAYDWVSVAEAGRRLKLSTSEIRRRIRVGQLVGERQPRGPGDTRDRFMVQMPTQPETEQEPLNDASVHALARAALKQVGAMADALERATDRSIALIERAARAEVERDNALARASELAEQLAAERARADAAEAERDRLRGRRWWRW